MQPREDASYSPPNEPRRERSAGHTALLWVIVALLAINILLTLYVSGVTSPVPAFVQGLFAGFLGG